MCMTPLARLVYQEQAADRILAANPYGCNKYGHKPGCPKYVEKGDPVAWQQRKNALTFDAEGMSRDEAKAALKKLAGVPIRNDETNIEAYVNSRQKNKITSFAAIGKSEENGFSEGEHNLVASRTDELFRHATHINTYNDKNSEENGSVLLSVKRFACPIMVKGEPAVAFLTVKETNNEGHKIYSVELNTVENLRDNLDRIKHLLKDGNSNSTDKVISKVENMFKTYF